MRVNSYEMNIVLDNGKPTYEYKHNTTNDTFIEGRHRSAYKIVLKNNTSGRVLMVPSVDGLSILDGKPATKDSRGYVVNGYSSIEIPGWTLDNEKVAKFVFGTRDNSYANVSNIPQAENNIGVIGVLVFNEETPKNNIDYTPKNNIDYTPNCNPNYMYGQVWSNGVCVGLNGQNTQTLNCMYSTSNNIGISSAQALTTHPDFSMGTEFGAPQSFHTTNTEFVKASTIPAAVLSIYYDTLQNLKLRGVNIPSKPRANTIMPRAFSDVGCQPPNNWLYGNN